MCAFTRMRFPERLRSLCKSRPNGGESGIRTHGRLPYTRFPSVRLRPLGHLSGCHLPTAPGHPVGMGSGSGDDGPEATATRPTAIPGSPPLGLRPIFVSPLARGGETHSTRTPPGFDYPLVRPVDACHCLPHAPATQGDAPCPSVVDPLAPRSPLPPDPPLRRSLPESPGPPESPRPSEFPRFPSHRSPLPFCWRPCWAVRGTAGRAGRRIRSRRRRATASCWCGARSARCSG